MRQTKEILFSKLWISYNNMQFYKQIVISSCLIYHCIFSRWSSVVFQHCNETESAGLPHSLENKKKDQRFTVKDMCKRNFCNHNSITNVAFGIFMTTKANKNLYFTSYSNALAQKHFKILWCKNRQGCQKSLH